MGSTATPDSFLETRRGTLILALTCLAGFLDVIDTTIVNVALPSIREDIHFSVQSLQWIASGYLLTYGGFLLLGGRAADLLGLRRIFVGVQTAANAGVSADKAGLAAALGSASAQLGSALGLAIFTAIATSHTEHRVNAGVAHTMALTCGFHYGLVACSIFLVLASLIATRASNSRHQAPAAEPEPVADAVGG